MHACINVVVVVLLLLLYRAVPLWQRCKLNFTKQNLAESLKSN
jgi:hypothetical protein